MRYVISVDMEGVAGVVHPDDITPGTAEYERCRGYMTDEASAAVRGILAEHPDASVVVVDAHARFRNIVPDRLDRRCRLVRGEPRRDGMVTGIGADTDGVLLVGYHGAAGTPGSVLAHTVSGGSIAQVRLDGVAVGEIGLAARLAQSDGVPALFVSGDDTACAEARDLMPNIGVATVKQALGARAAESLHPAVACELIEAQVRTAVASSVAATREDGPVDVEIDLLRPHQADSVARIPGADRIAARTVAFHAADGRAAYNFVDLAADVAAL